MVRLKRKCTRSILIESEIIKNASPNTICTDVLLRCPHFQCMFQNQFEYDAYTHVTIERYAEWYAKTKCTNATMACNVKQ